MHICWPVGDTALCSKAEKKNKKREIRKRKLELANVAASCFFPSEKPIVQLINFSKPKLVS